MNKKWIWLILFSLGAAKAHAAADEVVSQMVPIVKWVVSDDGGVKAAAQVIREIREQKDLALTYEKGRAIMEQGEVTGRYLGSQVKVPAPALEILRPINKLFMDVDWLLKDRLASAKPLVELAEDQPDYAFQKLLSNLSNWVRDSEALATLLANPENRRNVDQFISKGGVEESFFVSVDLDFLRAIQRIYRSDVADVLKPSEGPANFGSQLAQLHHLLNQVPGSAMSSISAKNVLGVLEEVQRPIVQAIVPDEAGMNEATGRLLEAARSR